jgi:hypothetical protein
MASPCDRLHLVPNGDSTDRGCPGALLFALLRPGLPQHESQPTHHFLRLEPLPLPEDMMGASM